MGRLYLPLPFDDLRSKPELLALVNLSDDMIQALSLVSGYDGSQRRLLRCSPTGILHTIPPRSTGVVNITATAANFLWQGSAVDTTEVMIRSNPDNAGRVWVNLDTPAAADTGWPLDGGEVINLTLNNLNNLHLKIIADLEKVIVLYSR